MLRSTRSTTALFVLLLTVAGLPLPAAAQEAEPAPADYEVTQFAGEPVPLSPRAQDVSMGDDFVTSAISLGFATRFFGQPAFDFWIGSNGFVTLHFLTGPGCCAGQALPTRGDPDGIIAGFWTDLDPTQGGTIRFDRLVVENESAVVVDYDQVRVKGTLHTASFQVVVRESGVFELRYRNATAGGAVAAVGAENLDGTRGVTLFHGGNVTLAQVGFRFTPIIEPTRDPFVTALDPQSAAAGSTVSLLGGNFSQDAQVRLGGSSVPTGFVSDTHLLFLVPGGFPTGFFDVEVVHPDGKRAVAPGPLEVFRSFGFDGVFPATATQGGLVTFLGSGFTASTVPLVDGVAHEVVGRGAAFLEVRLPRDLAPGLHDVGVQDPFGGRILHEDGLLVLGLPDLAIDSFSVERRKVRTALAPGGVDVPGPWQIRLGLENRGDATARGIEVEVWARPAPGPLFPLGGAWELVLQDSGREAAPGDAVDLRFEWHNSAVEAGDFEFFARAIPTGALSDRDLRNNEALAEAWVHVGGLGGFDDVCALPFACQARLSLEWQRVEESERDQEDRHVGAALRLDARMEAPDFSFGDFPIVFTTTQTHDDGSFTECTTWRFLGGSSGFLSVRMAAGNGLEGAALVPEAAGRKANGTATTWSWDQLVLRTGLNQVVLFEGERASHSTTAPDALEEYVFRDDAGGVFAWSLVATGLTGDFTHCSFRTPLGGGEERFVFAALPPDVDELRPSFEGVGFADVVEVVAQGVVTRTESRPFDPLDPFGA